MAGLVAAGAPAPSVTLPGLDGGRVAVGPAPDAPRTVLFFFKVDCPTSPVAAPVVEALRRAYEGPVSFAGISQDDGDATRSFVRGLGFPIAIDAPDFPASAAYGLVAVPTLVVVGEAGRVASVTTGWSRDAYNAVARDLAGAAKRPFVPASTPDDGRPAWKPG